MKSRDTKYNVNDPLVDNTNLILKNKLNIESSEKLEKKEAECLAQAYEKLSLEYSDKHIFSEKDVQYIHFVFLENIYDWAGEYRTVDISSDKIRWCHAAYIPNQMKVFGKMLENTTPFNQKLKRDELLRKLAKIHGELIIIHPFRDGNGRITRLLCDLLMMQAGKLPLDQTRLENENERQKYYAAINQVWKEAKYEKLIEMMGLMINF